MMGFLDRITGTINSAGENVVKKAKDVSEVSKRNNQIEESQKNIEAIYTEIGKFCWENRAEMEKNEQIAKWIIQIENENAKIKALREELRQLRGVEICKNCGAELRKGANFCNTCGAPVERETEKRQVCKNCGAELEGGEKFCMNCGAKIEIIRSEPEWPKVNFKRCSSCGQEVQPGDVFCKFCGTPVVQSLVSQDTDISPEESGAVGKGFTEE